MLLNTILALVPLVHTLPAPIPQDPAPSLAWAIPGDALAAIHWNDPKGFVANEKKSAWINFFKDSRWLEIEGLEAMGSEDEAALELVSDVWELLAGSNDLVLWLEESDYINPSVYLVFQSTDAAIQAAVSTPNTLFEGSMQTVDGHSVVADELFALTWKDGLGVLLIGDDAGQSIPDAIATLKRVQSTDKPGGLFESTDLGADRHPGGIEALININGVLDMFPEGDADLAMIPSAAMAEVRGIGWIYLSMTFGAGQNADINMVIPYLEDGYLAKLFSFASAANMEAFKRVPADAYGASAFNFDLAGATSWILEELIDGEVMTPDDLEGAMLMAEETVGFHPLDDLLNYFSGEMLQILFPIDASEYPLQEVIGGTYGLMLAQVTNVEEVNASLSSLSDFASSMLEVLETDETWGTRWAVDAMGMMEVEFGNFATDFFINMAPGALARMEAHRKAGPEALNILSSPEAKSTLAEVQGLSASIYHTSGMMKQISGSLRMQFDLDPELSGDLDFIGDLLDTLDEVAAEHLNGWYANGFTADGRLRFKTVTR